MLEIISNRAIQLKLAINLDGSSFSPEWVDSFAKQFLADGTFRLVVSNKTNGQKMSAQAARVDTHCTLAVLVRSDLALQISIV